MLTACGQLLLAEIKRDVTLRVDLVTCLGCRGAVESGAVPLVERGGYRVTA